MIVLTNLTKYINIILLFVMNQVQSGNNFLSSTLRNSNKIYKIVTVIKVIKHQLKIYIFNTQLIKQLTQYYIYYCSKTVNYIVILWLVHAWKKRHFTASTELFYPVPKQCHTHLIRSFCVFLRFYCLSVCPVCLQSSLSV